MTQTIKFTSASKASSRRALRGVYRDTIFEQQVGQAVANGVDERAILSHKGGLQRVFHRLAAPIDARTPSNPPVDLVELLAFKQA